MKRVAVISAILENPSECQQKFNDIISNFKGIIKGRMGIPLEESGLAVVSVVVTGELPEINSLSGKIGSIPGVTAKTSISREKNINS